MSPFTWIDLIRVMSRICRLLKIAYTSLFPKIFSILSEELPKRIGVCGGPQRDMSREHEGVVCVFLKTERLRSVVADMGRSFT